LALVDAANPATGTEGPSPELKRHEPPVFLDRVSPHLPMLAMDLPSYDPRLQRVSWELVLNLVQALLATP